MVGFSSLCSGISGLKLFAVDCLLCN